MGKSKTGTAVLVYSDLVAHVRQMIAYPDPLAILVRGLILIDKALEDLIEAYAALPYSLIDREFRHPGLVQKAVFARALGAISEGELACIRRINKVRNDLAHRIPVNVTADDEESVVNVFRQQTKLFSGLDYDRTNFPKNFIFVLLVLFHFLTSHCHRTDIKLSHVEDESNTEAMMAIIMTQVMTTVVTTRPDLSDAQIMELVESKVREAKARRDEYRDEGQDDRP